MKSVLALPKHTFNHSYKPCHLMSNHELVIHYMLGLRSTNIDDCAFKVYMEK